MWFSYRTCWITYCIVCTSKKPYACTSMHYALSKRKLKNQRKESATLISRFVSTHDLYMSVRVRYIMILYSIIFSATLFLMYKCDWSRSASLLYPASKVQIARTLYPSDIPIGSPRTIFSTSARFMNCSSARTRVVCVS